MTETASNPTPAIAPVQFLGIQPGFGNEAALELYILLSPVGHHPVGSTVSRQTLLRHGYSLMPDGHDGGLKIASSIPVA